MDSDLPHLISALATLVAVIAAMVLLLLRWLTQLRQLVDPPTDSRPAPGPQKGREQQSIKLDENVQFTVYRPEVVEPGKWYPLLAFAHLSRRRPEDVAAGEPDPVAAVRGMAEQKLGVRADDYVPRTEDSSRAVPRAGVITFHPVLDGAEFFPATRDCLWQGPVHLEEFQVRALPDRDGQTLRGQMRIFFGPLLLAEINLVVSVDSRRAGERPSAQTPSAAVSASPYRKIFVSYSRRDEQVVRGVVSAAGSLGDEYLIDVLALRSGEHWNERLMQSIRDASVFQLFWSSNSMRSKFVGQEVAYALSLNRQNFIRPLYWEDPFPEDRAEGLPPDELSRLHFYKLPPAPIAETKAARAAPPPTPSPQTPPAPEPPLELFSGQRGGTIICNYCGSPIPSDRAFCGECGAPSPLAAPPFVPPQQSAGGARQTGYATPAGAHMPPAPAAPAAPKSRSKITGALAVMAFGVVMASVLSTMFVMQRSMRSGDPSMSDAGAPEVASDADVGISREEYERNKESYAEQARRGGHTIGSGADDGWLWVKVREVLRQSVPRGDSDIKVDVVNGVVTLRGAVATDYEKLRAAQVARRIEGVKMVENKLRVGGAGGGNQSNAGSRNLNSPPARRR